MSRHIFDCVDYFNRGGHRKKIPNLYPENNRLRERTKDRYCHDRSIMPAYEMDWDVEFYYEEKEKGISQAEKDFQKLVEAAERYKQYEEMRRKEQRETQKGDMLLRWMTKKSECFCMIDECDHKADTYIETPSGIVLLCNQHYLSAKGH